MCVILFVNETKTKWEKREQFSPHTRYPLSEHNYKHFQLYYITKKKKVFFSEYAEQTRERESGRNNGKREQKKKSESHTQMYKIHNLLFHLNATFIIFIFKFFNIWAIFFFCFVFNLHVHKLT